MNKLPVGWNSIVLGEITAPDAPIQYGVLKPGIRTANGIPMIRVTDIRSNKINDKDIYLISPELDEEFRRTRLKTDDILISVQGTVGRVAIVPASLEDANISRTLARIRSVMPSLAPWIRTALLSPQMQERIGEDVGGTTRDSLNIGDLREISIPLPPLDEQKRISAKLERLSRLLNRTGDELKHVDRLINLYKRATLDAAYAGTLSNVRKSTPGAWDIVELGSIIQAIYAGKNLRCEERPPRADENGVVKVSAVTWGSFNPMQSKTLPSDYAPLDRDRISPGDFLFSRANTLELVGACVLVEDAPNNLYLSDKILRLDMDDDLKPWLLWFLRSTNGRRQLESVSSGNQVSMRNISQGGLRSIRIPLPSREERDEIVRHVEHSFAAIDRLAAEARYARKTLDNLNQAILSKAFSGELVSQNPDDEPASALLAHIRAKRVTAGPTPKRGRRSRWAAA